MMKLILSDFPNPLRLHLLQNPLRLHCRNVNFSHAIGINRLFSKILPDFHCVAVGVDSHPYIHWILPIQRTFHAMNDAAEPKQKSMILAAPVPTERHVRHKALFNLVVVVLYKFLIRLTVEVQVLLLFLMISEFVPKSVKISFL